MNICEVIRYRRSVFPVDYIQKAIPKSVLEELLECANAAPTHKLTQPWRYVVFHQEGLKKLADVLQSLYKATVDSTLFSEKKYHSISDKVLKSGAVMAICVEFSGKVPEVEELASVACSVQNMWLAASDMGLGAYWSTPVFLNDLQKALQLESNVQCLGLFYLGYPKQHTPRLGTRSPIEEKVTWVST